MTLQQPATGENVVQLSHFAKVSRKVFRLRRANGAVAFDDFSSRRQPIFVHVIPLFAIIKLDNLFFGTTKTPLVITMYTHSEISGSCF